MNQLLGSPCQIGTLTIRNRTVLEAMGNGLSELNGNVSPAEIAFYAARAKGGIGLIMTECVSVDSETGRANPRNMCIDRDEQIPGYQRLADAVHENGAKVFVELYHPGRQGVSMFNGGRKMFAPSPIECNAVHEPVVEMTLDDIQTMVQKFIDGAVRCQKAGIDGVLIHGAHGYLVNQFLSPYTNKRTDDYGGTPEKRARFALEIIRGIRAACGPDYPIAIRISACEYLDYIGLPQEEGITLELSKTYCRMFEEAGIDLLDVSAGIYETMNTAWEPTGFDQGWKVELARELKKVATVPVVCTALIREPAFAEQLLQDGVCDFVGSARAHLADPEWPNKAIAGQAEEIRPCISCLNCMKGLMSSGTVRCAVNAQACMELERSDLRINGNGRPVVIIGAGPAGMEAARVLAIRGFSVTVLEKEAEPGGALLQAGKPPHKEKILLFVDYLKRQLDRLGVRVECGVEVTPDLVAARKPYAVFLAAGASPVVPASIPGIHGANVLLSSDILTGAKSLTGQRVAVIGAGMTGLETAEYLDSVGNTVSVFDMLDGVAIGEHFQNVIDIEKRLGNVPQYVGHQLVSISETGCIFQTKDGSSVEHPCDAVVLAMGMKPNLDFAKQFRDFPNYQLLGTNKVYSSIAPAVESAYIAAFQLD